MKVITSLCVNLYVIERVQMLKRFRGLTLLFSLYNKLLEMLERGVIDKEIIRGTAEHGYLCLLAFSYMIDTHNVGSSYCIMVSRDTHRFMYYLLALGA